MIISKDHLIFNINYSEIYKKDLIETKTNPLVSINKDNFAVWKNKENNIHRDHYPAIMNSNTWYFYQNGFPHRENKPAILLNNEKIFTFVNHGKIHRIGGFALVGILKERYELYVDGIQYKNEDDYIQACKNWIQKNIPAHDSFEIFENLNKKNLTDISTKFFGKKHILLRIKMKKENNL